MSCVVMSCVVMCGDVCGGVMCGDVMCGDVTCGDVISILQEIFMRQCPTTTISKSLCSAGTSVKLLCFIRRRGGGGVDTGISPQK